MPRRHKRVEIATDGLFARDNGSWAREKLSFLDEYLPTALNATRKKLERVYVDLFAGPGLNIERETGAEFKGAFLRAIEMEGTGTPRPRFTSAYAVNLKKVDHEALQARVARAVAAGQSNVPRDRLFIRRGDANAEIPGILREIHPKTYLVVFADIEAPRQWPWTSVEALRSMGHTSVDLYVLFPLEMGVRRLIPYVGEGSPDVLTRFFGCDSWKGIIDRYPTSAPDQVRERGKALLDLYVARLKAAGWGYVIKARDVRRTGDAGLYRMLLATNDPAGDKIAKWAALSEEKRAQYTMNL